MVDDQEGAQPAHEAQQNHIDQPQLEAKRPIELLNLGIRQRVGFSEVYQ